MLKHNYVIHLSKCTGYLTLGYMHFQPGIYSIIIIIIIIVNIIIIIIKAAIF